MQSHQQPFPSGTRFVLRVHLPPVHEPAPRACERVREQERQHLAQEVHDTLGGELIAARLQLASLAMRLGEQPAEIAQRLEQLQATLRTLATLKSRVLHGLRPDSLHGMGLTGALQAMAGPLAADAGIRLQMQLDEVHADRSTELVIFRVVQESLTNMVKHAAATEAEILLRDQPCDIYLFVRDNGRGFRLPDRTVSGHGLDGMRGRVESAGGQLSVASEPGKGTQIAVTLPKCPQ